jgi:hypothetical protein
MKTLFTAAAAAVIAMATLSGCGVTPTVATAGFSSPTSMVAVRNDVQRALTYQKTILGTDELKPGVDRGRLELVVRQYRSLSASAIAHSKSNADMQAYVVRLSAAQKRDPGLKKGIDLTALGNSDLVFTTGEYQSAFKTVSDDIDAKLGTTKRERKD